MFKRKCKIFKFEGLVFNCCVPTVTFLRSTLHEFHCWRLLIVKKKAEGHLCSFPGALFRDRGLAFQTEGPQTQPVHVNLLFPSLSIWIFMFVFLSVCPCISPCDKCMFYSWVPAGTSPVLTVLSSVYCIQWTSEHRIEEKWITPSAYSQCAIRMTIFLATLRSLERWGRWEEGQNWGGKGGLGEKKAMLLYHRDAWMTKEKNTARLFLKQCVWKSSLTLESSDTHKQKHLPLDRASSLLEIEVLKALSNCPSSLWHPKSVSHSVGGPAVPERLWLRAIGADASVATTQGKRCFYFLSPSGQRP